MSGPISATTKNANILVYDVGSTYTKATAFNLDQSLSFLARAQSPTTLEDVLIGVNAARQSIVDQGISFTEDLKQYATCSAAGGLRMVALGYMPRVTAKAAKEVAMTAGARVMEVISYDESPEFREEVLQEIRPDIILLAGGTDGGDIESPVENARIIAGLKTKAMVVVACNKDAQGEVTRIFDTAGIAYTRVPNIMPTIHELNVKPAREAIHAQFIKQITKAKGLDRLQAMLADQTVMPTPGAVLLASELLAKGTHEAKGIGGLILVDIGGATTDIHSALPELEELKLEERGLVINNEKQFSYRTVEGNLGLRVSATGIPEAVGPLAILKDTGSSQEELTEDDILCYTKSLEKDPSFVPDCQKDRNLDCALAVSALAVALRRHAGHLSKEADPILGTLAGTPVGRDLRLVKHVLAVGGIFYYSSTDQKQEILSKAFGNPGISLLPSQPNFYFDRDYILYALGVLSTHYPNYVLEFLTNYIRED